MAQAPMNPLHLKAALSEAEVHVQLLSSRAQRLAADLAESQATCAALQQALEAERAKSDGLSSKLEELQSEAHQDGAQQTGE